MTDYQTEYGRSYALVMGIDAYRHMNPLTAAVRGAEALADILDAEYGFQVTLLTDRKVTRDSVFGWLSTLARESGPDDRALIYFAGHGLTRGTDLYERGYLGLYDSEIEKWHSLLAMDDIIEEARFIKAKHLLYLLDCCFGGLALDTRSTGDTPRELEYYLTRPVRYAIAAGGKEVVDDALAPGFEYSLFTHHLLTWLSSDRVQPPGGIWRARELGNYLERAVGRDRRSGHKPNHNYLSGSGDGDFLFKWEADEAGSYVTSGLSSAMSSTSWQVRQGAVAAMIDMAKGSDPERAAYAARWLERIAETDENEDVRSSAATFLEAMRAEPDPHPAPDTDEIPRPEPELIPVPRAVEAADNRPHTGFVGRWGALIGASLGSILVGLEPVVNSDPSPVWIEFIYNLRGPLGIAGGAVMLAVVAWLFLRRRPVQGGLTAFTLACVALGYLYDPFINGTSLAEIFWTLRFVPYLAPPLLLVWLTAAAIQDRS